MNLFSDLSRSPVLTVPPDGSPGEFQRQLDALFPVAVSRSPLRLWSLGDPITATGDRLLIGVATWSVADMALLDAVARSSQREPPLVVEVFNVGDCPSMGDFERYLPGIGTVFHTPVAGLWSDGHLIQRASGKAARELIARVCSVTATVERVP